MSSAESKDLDDILEQIKRKKQEKEERKKRKQEKLEKAESKKRAILAEQEQPIIEPEPVRLNRTESERSVEPLQLNQEEIDKLLEVEENKEVYQKMETKNVKTLRKIELSDDDFKFALTIITKALYQVIEIATEKIPIEPENLSYYLKYTDDSFTSLLKIYIKRYKRYDTLFESLSYLLYIIHRDPKFVSSLQKGEIIPSQLLSDIPVDISGDILSEIHLIKYILGSIQTNSIPLLDESKTEFMKEFVKNVFFKNVSNTVSLTDITFISLIKDSEIIMYTEEIDKKYIEDQDIEINTKIDSLDKKKQKNIEDVKEKNKLIEKLLERINTQDENSYKLIKELDSLKDDIFSIQEVQKNIQIKLETLNKRLKTNQALLNGNKSQVFCFDKNTIRITSINRYTLKNFRHTFIEKFRNPVGITRQEILEEKERREPEAKEIFDIWDSVEEDLTKLENTVQVAEIEKYPEESSDSEDFDVLEKSPMRFKNKECFECKKTFTEKGLETVEYKNRKAEVVEFCSFECFGKCNKMQ